MGPRTLCPGQSVGVAGTDSAIPERWQASSQRNPEAGLAQMKIIKDFEEIWAAGGTPTSVFCLTPDQLTELTGGKFENVALSRSTSVK